MLPALALLISAPAYAQPAPPVNFKGLYHFGFSGIQFGELGMEVLEHNGDYGITSDITTTGLMRVFVRHSSHSTVNKTAQDLVYETNYRTKNKPKYVKLTAKNGTYIEEIATPKDDGISRQPVPAELKKGAYDPLSFILAMRKELYAVMRDGRKTYSLHYYDGRRLTKGNFTVLGKQKLTLDGVEKDVIAVAARRELVAGFSEKERRNYSEKEPAVIVYYSDDERLLPIRLEAKMVLGTVDATLVKECSADESCLLNIKN